MAKKPQGKAELVRVVLQRMSHGDAFRSWPEGGYENHMSRLRARIALDYEDLGEARFRDKYRIYLY